MIHRLHNRTVIWGLWRTVIWGLWVLAALLGGCSTIDKRVSKQEQIPLDLAASILPEASLLDVWIEVFEPGPIPKGDAQGITPEIRNAESRFVPVHLRNTMEQTGHWGGIRVVPQNADGGEVRIEGQILESNGEILELRIQAWDSRDKLWLEKTYRGEAGAKHYDETVRGSQDAFQNLYNSIVNDLSRHKKTLDQESLTKIRRVAELRFAADLTPDVFADYLSASEDGYFIKRLPAEQDPMLERIRTIRERDNLLIDTVNNHYDGFYRDIWAPYDNWRRFRLEEAENLRRIERDALTRKLLGIGAILGAIAIEVGGSNSTRASTSTLRNVMVIGGALAVKSGFDKDSEKQIHVDAIEELDASFESETSPLVVEVEGETHRLTGSAEEQYAKWRVLLNRIHVTETGMPDTVQ